jgi:hypothetical protein
MKNGPFKLKSGNKPSFAKMAGVSPIRKDKKMTATFEETPNEETLKKYRAAMAKNTDQRTNAEKNLIKKVNEIRSKQEAKKEQPNVDEID